MPDKDRLTPGRQLALAREYGEDAPQGPPDDSWRGKLRRFGKEYPVAAKVAFGAFLAIIWVPVALWVLLMVDARAPGEHKFAMIRAAWAIARSFAGF